jgi:single-strand DNA-binding protein
MCRFGRCGGKFDGAIVAHISQRHIRLICVGGSIVLAVAMYLNRITLMGYLAHDAESRTSRDGRPYAVLDLATKESWKDSKGEWQSHSETHRCVAWGQKLASFAAAFKRGAHLQVDGSLRTREFDKDGVRQRVSEIRVSSIVKIDKAQRQTESNVPDIEFTDSVA